MAKLILLNGPRGCGKTELMKCLKYQHGAVDRRCKDKLFKLTQEMFCVEPRTFFEIYDDRDRKEIPNEKFMLKGSEYGCLMQYLDKEFDFAYADKMYPISVRDAMIYVSEFLCKPAFGVDYFGVARAKDIRPNEIAVDDSCGFNDEVPPSIDLLGQENVMLIRIYGRGTFDNDSREYIRDGLVDRTYDVYNTDTEAGFQLECIDLIDKFLKGEA